MKKIIILGMWSILITNLFSQTRSSQRTSTSRFEKKRRDDQEEKEIRASLIAAVMGSYLNDKNPEVRKNALKIIVNMEDNYNPAILNILIERLRVEKDWEVKALIEKTIEVLSRKSGWIK